MDAIRPPILLICSVELEAAPIHALLAGSRAIEIASTDCVSGTVSGVPIILLVGGMGKTNAAHALSAVLALHRVSMIIGFGVAGAYLRSGLEPGAIALASSEVYGDEGVRTSSGWIDTAAIGIPLARVGANDFYNEFPVDARELARAQRRLCEAGIDARVGRFATVSCCSGTAERGNELAARFNAICETMEGAAYAHIAALHQTPFLEVRAVSNLVEDRDTSRWRLPEAAAEAARAATIIAGAK
ncbi:MAG TPA: futalosine hydrolase [Longimicrobiaceae bacterium]|nr:futalosine hydrolase [Longimicrobiaceae bacterium]